MALALASVVQEVVALAAVVLVAVAEEVQSGSGMAEVEAVVEEVVVVEAVGTRP